MSYRVLVLLASTVDRSAAQTLEVTVAATPPPAVTFVGTFKNNVAPRIDERLAASGKGFRIKWNHAYSGTLDKFNEVFEAVEEGIAGAGLILKNFEPSNLPLEAYAVYMPFVTLTRAQIVEIDAELRKEITELNEAYAGHNQVFLTSGVNDSMQFFTKFPVRKVGDLKNRKMGSSGSFAQWLRGTGAVTVNPSMIHSYTNIKNGVYEGYPVSVILAFVYKTWSAAPYLTRADFGPTVNSAITFNADVWKKIPSWAQRIVREEAEKWAAYQDKVDDGKRAKFLGIMKSKGVKVSSLPDAECREWAVSMPNIAREWAERLDKRGQPGTELMKAYMNQLRARGVEVAFSSSPFPGWRHSWSEGAPRCRSKRRPAVAGIKGILPAAPPARRFRLSTWRLRGRNSDRQHGNPAGFPDGRGWRRAGREGQRRGRKRGDPPRNAARSEIGRLTASMPFLVNFRDPPPVPDVTKMPFLANVRQQRRPEGHCAFAAFSPDAVIGEAVGSFLS